MSQNDPLSTRGTQFIGPETSEALTPPMVSVPPGVMSFTPTLLINISHVPLHRPFVLTKRRC
jgi:hypothetical protein